MQLRSELVHTKGDGLSITEFLDKINNIDDNLALAGKPVEDDDIIYAIMTNVGLTYEATVISTQARESPISYGDLVGLLLAFEM